MLSNGQSSFEFQRLKKFNNRLVSDRKDILLSELSITGLPNLKTQKSGHIIENRFQLKTKETKQIISQASMKDGELSALKVVPDLNGAGKSESVIENRYVRDPSEILREMRNEVLIKLIRKQKHDQEREKFSKERIAQEEKKVVERDLKIKFLNDKEAAKISSRKYLNPYESTDIPKPTVESSENAEYSTNVSKNASLSKRAGNEPQQYQVRRMDFLHILVQGRRNENRQTLTDRIEKKEENNRTNARRKLKNEQQVQHRSSLSKGKISGSDIYDTIKKLHEGLMGNKQQVFRADHSNDTTNLKKSFILQVSSWLTTGE